MTIRYFKMGALGLAVFTSAGCVTLEQTTLPASQKKTYEYIAYTIQAPQDAAWRFLYEDKDLQLLSFYHKDFASYLNFWVSPVLQTLTQEDQEKEVIDYFQNKLLEEFKLSPDILLSDQDIAHDSVTFGGRTYRSIKLNFELEKDHYELTIYYYVNMENKILYSASVLTERDRIKPAVTKTDWPAQLTGAVSGIIESVSYLQPAEKEMQRARVAYAYANFVESTKNKYLKSEAAKVKEKYDIAVKETKAWQAMKENNYLALEYLGILATFNNKFEQYAEGFDKARAEDYFRKTLEIHPYYKNARVNLAGLYMETGDIDKAISEYEFAIKVSPNDEDLYYKLGKIYEEKKGDKKRAREYYEKGLRYWSSGFGTKEELEKKLKDWEK